MGDKHELHLTLSYNEYEVLILGLETLGGLHPIGLVREAANELKNLVRREWLAAEAQTNRKGSEG
jgi:hypothetical protein